MENKRNAELNPFMSKPQSAGATASITTIKARLGNTKTVDLLWAPSWGSFTNLNIRVRFYHFSAHGHMDISVFLFPVTGLTRPVGVRSQSDRKDMKHDPVYTTEKPKPSSSSPSAGFHTEGATRTWRLIKNTYDVEPYVKRNFKWFYKIWWFSGNWLLNSVTDVVFLYVVST